MSLSKSKCWYSNNCLHFLKRAVPLSHLNFNCETHYCFCLGKNRQVLVKAESTFFIKNKILNWTKDKVGFLWLCHILTNFRLIKGNFEWPSPTNNIDQVSFLQNFFFHLSLFKWKNKTECLFWACKSFFFICHFLNGTKLS
jgi:hypothetical protein